LFGAHGKVVVWTSNIITVKGKVLLQVLCPRFNCCNILLNP